MNLYEKRVQRLHDHVVANTRNENEGKKPSTPSTVKELQAALKEKGIECPSNAKKEDLIKLLEESENIEKEPEDVE